MIISDIARGAYTRSPQALRRWIGPAVAQIPTRLKFGSTYGHWRRLIAECRTDGALAQSLQRTYLQRMLTHAHAKSPFYRLVLDSALGPNPDFDAFEVADLAQLPILTRQELTGAGTAVLTMPADQLDPASTAGSNGDKPFLFHLDKNRSPREMAFVYDCWATAGFREGDAKISLRGRQEASDNVSREWEPALRELRLGVTDMSLAAVRGHLNAIDEKAIPVIYGYPSAIEVLCRQFARLERVPKRPITTILPISEPLFAYQREAIRAVLGEVKFATFYGLSEKVLFAIESADGRYAFDPLYGIAEIVDADGRPVQPGEEGRLIGTALLGKGMPFLRYDTGDMATLVERPSIANGYRLIASGLVPRRKPGFLVGADGTRIVMTGFTPEDPAFYAAIREFQFRQDTPGAVTLNYVPEGPEADDRAAGMAAEFSRMSSGRLVFTPNRVTRIAGAAGKRVFIDQRIPSDCEKSRRAAV